MARFTKGHSGNPAGRPPGVADKRTALRGLLEPHAATLVAKAVELAKNGDVGALRLCLERLVPQAREEPVRFKLPPIQKLEDCAKAQGAIVAAVAAGELLPSQGRDLAALVDGQRAAYETGELADRLAAIERALRT